jgi:hypothetical protein
MRWQQSLIKDFVGRAIAGFPPRRPGFEPGLDHLEFIVDKVALGQAVLVIRFHLQIIPPTALPSSPSGAGTIGQRMFDIPRGLNFTPPLETKIIRILYLYFCDHVCYISLFSIFSCFHVLVWNFRVQNSVTWKLKFRLIYPVVMRKDKMR